MEEEQEVLRESYGKLPDLQTIERLNRIIVELKENTVALVEMGVAVKRLENRVNHVLNKGVVRG